jgi:hypothetical protein
MATFRYSAAIVLALLFLACSPPSAQEATIVRDEIEHVVPKRDFVGPLPARFEWTAAKGVEEYTMTIENEVDVLLFEARTRNTFLDWPKGNTLDPGTYFWRVVGISGGGRGVADSGRAAFVVVER